MLLKVSRLPVLRNILYTRGSVSIRRFSDEKDDKDDKPDKTEGTKKATNRLMELLAQMPTKETVKLEPKVQIPKPTRALKRKKVEESSSSSSSSSSDEDEKPKNIVEAARKVATHLGTDPTQTESELLSKFLGIAPGQTASLTDVIAGMKISHENDGTDRAKFVREAMSRGEPDVGGEGRRNTFERRRREREGRDGENYMGGGERRRPYERRQVASSEVTSVDLFTTEPLGIFTNATDLKHVDFLDTWKRLEQRELKLAAARPPANYYEKMALWTEQGKLWRFPIDNEQDIGPETNVSFAQHIFLDELLEPWCPPKGPVRHFMELVIVGMSKNAYMTVEEKHAHINYYKEYFESKKELLQQLIDTKESKAAAEAAEQKHVE